MNAPLSPSVNLSGIRVLEIGRSDTVHIAGMLLADQGAEVVRIDAVESGTCDTAYHTITDRAKKHYLLDPTSPDHIAAANSLAKGAHVLLDDAGKKLETGFLLAPESLASLIRCTVVPSEDETYPEHWTEEMVSARTGLYEDGLSIGKPPRFYDLPIAATLGALYTVNAVARALIGRHRFNAAETVRIPLDRICMFAQSLTIIIRSNPPVCWEPFRWVGSPFMCTWRTAGDGCIYFHAGMPRHLRSFLFFLDKIGFGSEKKAIKKYLHPATRRNPFCPQSVREAIGITRILRRLFMKKTANEWETLLGNAGLCCTKIRTFEEWRVHPQVTQTTQILECPIGGEEKIRVPGPLFDLRNQPSATVAPAGYRRLSAQDAAALWPPRPAPEAAPATRPLPLSGIRVLDLGRVIAGPYAGRLFAEAGAEVLHLSLRGNHLDWEEPFGTIYNMGKKSVAVDITRPEGRDAFRKIVTWFKPDIIIHNFMDDSAEKIGCDYARCREIDEKIICVNFRGYARGGPWADYPGFEQNVQSASGILGTFCGTSTPRLLPVPMNDLCAGLAGSFGALCALLNRERNSKQGDLITACIATPSILVHLHVLDDAAAAERTGLFHRYFRASDGWFILSGRCSDLHRLGTIPLLSCLDGSIASICSPATARLFRSHSVSWWQSALKSIDADTVLTITARQTLSAVLKKELARPAPLFSYRHHEGFGKVLCSRPPLAAATGQVDELGTAPYPGFHNDEILPQALIDPVPLRIAVPPIVDDGSLLQQRAARIGWFMKQAKWLAVIAYRGFGMRLR